MNSINRVLAILIATTVLAGCASSGGSYSAASTNEKFLELSSNNPRLIELYKERLRDQEDVGTRLKLAKAYLDVGDNDSCLFTLSPLIRSGKGGSESFYLQGVAQYNTGRLRQAETSLQIAINKARESAKAVNMLGVVYAELGNLAGARQQFNQAREMMYDDLVIKNNLALVDMLEGKYQDAVVLLMPTYLNNPEQADSQLKANLAILLSKLGSFETLRRVYGEQYSDAQLLSIFNDLKRSVPVLRDYQPITATPSESGTVPLPQSTWESASSI